MIADLMQQSQIRGKHATGVSYIFGGKIKSIVEPVPVREFLKQRFVEIAEDLSQEQTINLIAHNRYSTSGLEHNQPIFNETLSIAMNGVITQADPKHWRELYEVECQTTNDTELAHKYLLLGKHPLAFFGTASMTIVGLWSSGKLFAFRNNRRPGYLYQSKDFAFVASTSDIIFRATKLNAMPMKSGVIYQLYDLEWMEAGNNSEVQKMPDLQIENYTQ
jgi:predicted glutamine amidotransferase